MAALRKKLKSRSGASLVIALVFFLLCLMVGSVVLTAASANAGRLAAQRRTEQDYLTVSSAAALVRDELAGLRLQAAVTDGGDPVFTAGEGVSLLAGAAQTAAQSVFAGETPAEIPLNIAGPALDAVSGALTMDATYNITVTLSIPDADGARSPLTVVVPAAAQSYTERSTTDPYEDPVTHELIEGTVTVTVTTTLVWGEGVIGKGAAA